MKALSRVQGSVVNISSEGSAWSEQVDDYNEADCPGQGRQELHKFPGVA